MISQIATFYHTGELASIDKIVSEFIDEIEKENWTVVDYYFDIKNIST